MEVCILSEKKEEKKSDIYKYTLDVRKKVGNRLVPITIISSLRS